jgi:2-polyprenyl-3-methyl-5-hydroxy-6-metoxy-1,4-benzoquinol methylase
MSTERHWESVYGTKSETEVSWYQTHAELSLRLIRETGVPKDAAVIDIGGGASTLVDDLLDEGFTGVSVLDLSAVALKVAQHRLGHRSDQVNWNRDDILEVDLPKHHFDVWHDRAVFHFLTDEEDRRRYVESVIRAVKPGGFVIVATFSENGPERCSGLPVKRYRADELHAEFGEPFTLLSHVRETHMTPSGKDQQFVYCFCRADGID